MHKRYAAIALIIITLLIVGCGEQKPQAAQKLAQPQFAADVKTTDSMYVASLAKMGPYANVGKSLNELMAWLAKNKIVPSNMPFGIYYDDPTKVKPESTKYEVCFPVPAKTKGDKIVTVKKFGPTLVAFTMYTGPYDKVGVVYPKLMEWINSNNYEVTGPAHEFYMNEPGKVLAESLKSEVAFPVKPKVPAQPTEGKK
jgi:effector-binding domain-containing protein